MVRRRCQAIALAVSLPLLLGADEKGLVVDPMTARSSWQVGGSRINYTLGESALGPSDEQVREGADSALKLTYDFRDARRSFISAYWTGSPIPGTCRAF
ncbi:MAG: hypothetical protein HON70_08815, partial [Lentisphaerae bacterium]|nr:hypothetical protein [Lentisphaerota bacterium]